MYQFKTSVHAYKRTQRSAQVTFENPTRRQNIIYTDYIDTPPKELLKQWVTEREPKPTLDNTAFYAVDEDGETYFYCGGSRLKVSEHFADAGKPVAELIENVIDYAAQ